MVYDDVCVSKQGFLAHPVSCCQQPCLSALGKGVWLHRFKIHMSSYNGFSILKIICQDCSKISIFVHLCVMIQFFFIWTHHFNSIEKKCSGGTK